MKRECITSVFIEFSVRPTLKAFFDSIVQASDSEGRVAEPSDHNFYKCYEMQPKQADGWIILKNMGYSEEFLNEVEEKLTDGTLHTNLTYSGDAQEPLFSVDILLPEVTGYYGEMDEVDTNYDADSLITQLEKCFSAKQLINGEITYEQPGNMSTGFLKSF